VRRGATDRPEGLSVGRASVNTMTRVVGNAARRGRGICAVGALAGKETIAGKRVRFSGVGWMPRPYDNDVKGFDR